MPKILFYEQFTVQTPLTVPALIDTIREATRPRRVRRWAADPSRPLRRWRLRPTGFGLGMPAWPGVQEVFATGKFTASPERTIVHVTVRLPWTGPIALSVWSGVLLFGIIAIPGNGPVAFVMAFAMILFMWAMFAGMFVVGAPRLRAELMDLLLAA